jgi:Protein of unknown function (DUF3455)
MGVGIAVTTATLAMSQVAHADPAPPTLPDSAKNIFVDPATNKLFLVGHATGVQIYTCNGAGSWGSSVPRADLVDDNGKLIVKHSQGPTWTAVPDGSAVSLVPGQKPTPAVSPAPGQKPTPADSPADNPAPTRDIPWLLVPVGPASTTPGVLTGTTSIQRINTQGGIHPPDAECNAQTNQKAVEVPYKADYYFWKATA